MKRLTYTRTVAEGAKYDVDFCNITHPVAELNNLYLYLNCVEVWNNLD